MPTTQTTIKKPANPRIVAVVPPVVKQRAQKLADEITDGNLGDLVAKLIKDNYKTMLADAKAKKIKVKTPKKVAKKSATATTRSTKRTAKKTLVGSSHGTTLKPARKGSTRNAASKSAKRSSTKNVVTTNRRRKSAGTTAKNRRTTNRSS